MFYVLSDTIFFEFVGGWGAVPKTIGMRFDQSQNMPFMNAVLLNPNGFGTIDDVKEYLTANIPTEIAGQTTLSDDLTAFASDQTKDSFTIFGNSEKQYIIKKETTGTPPVPIFNIYSAPMNFQQDPASAFSAPVNLADMCAVATPTQVASSPNAALFNTFSSKWQMIENGAIHNSATNLINGAFSINGPVASLAVLLVFTLITPFLALMTTLASFKVFSGLLGGDVEIALISRLL